MQQKYGKIIPQSECPAEWKMLKIIPIVKPGKSLISVLAK
jgi:hypothetical protein